MVWNGIPRVCFYFCFTERNSELFLLPLKGSEWNSKSLLLFLFHRTEFRVVFSSAAGFRREFREFASIFVKRKEFRVVFSTGEKFGMEFQELSVLQNSRSSVGNNHLFRLFCQFRRIIFLSKIRNPTAGVLALAVVPAFVASLLLL